MDDVVTLLPSFDEYLVGYRDRSAMVAAEDSRHVIAGGLFLPLIVRDGQILGRWRRTEGPAALDIRLEWFRRPSQAAQTAAMSAARRYGEYAGKPLRVSSSSLD